MPRSSGDESSRRTGNRTSGLLTRLARVPIVSVLLAALGALAVVDGIVIAVQAKAATPLLGAGVALLFLSFAFRDDVGEVRVGWGDASVSVVRGVRTALEESAGVDDSEEFRERIAELANSLEAVEARLHQTSAAQWSQGARNLLVSRLTRNWAAHGSPVLPALPWADATTAHGFRDGQVQLTIIYGDSTATALYCVVDDPQGGAHRTKVPPTLSILGTRAFSTTYPRDFPDADQLEPGSYSVTWLKVRRDDSEGEDIAVDSFEV